jgi:protein TonB
MKVWEYESVNPANGQRSTKNRLWKPLIHASQINCAGSISDSFIIKTDYMEPVAILQADPLDLLFENRNKSYGAYPLRKYYPQRLLISMGIMFSLVVLISFACFYNQSGSVQITKFPLPPDVIFQDVNLNQEVKPIEPQSRPNAPKPPATLQFNTPVIVAAQNVPEPMATIDNLQKNAIGITNSPGEPDNGDPHISGNSSATTTLQNTEPAEDRPEILDQAEVMPEFPGGLEALKRFLLKNLRMPENNLEEGTQVQVIARFVVGTDGRVRDIEITRPADTEFNTEVKRVISKMPDWKPGSQNHRNVAVYFSLPVNFVHAE